MTQKQLNTMRFACKHMNSVIAMLLFCTSNCWIDVMIYRVLALAFNLFFNVVRQRMTLCKSWIVIYGKIRWIQNAEKKTVCAKRCAIRSTEMIECVK